MKAKIITTAILSIIGITVCSIAVSSYNHVSALEYTTTYNNAFTLLPSISVSLSSASLAGSADLVISDLLPNTSSDSNEIIVNVESNNSTGYVLNSSVGSSTNPYSTYGRNLTNTTSDNYTFASLDYNDSKESLTDPNTWGYSYSDQTVATPTWSSYSGLPLYSDTTNIATLKSSNTPSSANGDNIGFKIAAKASITQGSGEYTNIINFIAVGNPTPTSFYDAFVTAASQPGSTITQLNGYYKMQDMTADIFGAVDLYDDNSHIQLIDTRDNEVYWIGKLKDNRCWLLDNLRLGSNDYSIDLTPQDTNIAEAWTLPRGITSNFGSYTTAQINAAYKNSVPSDEISQRGNWRAGVHYNFCSASAGTYCYDSESGTGNAEHDVCPIHWRLPIGGNNGEYLALYSIDAYNNYTGYRNALHLPTSGSYSTQLYDWGSYGVFWSSTRFGVSHSQMYYLVVSPSSINVIAGAQRGTGQSVRCIVNNQ